MLIVPQYLPPSTAYESTTALVRRGGMPFPVNPSPTISLGLSAAIVGGCVLVVVLVLLVYNVLSVHFILLNSCSDTFFFRFKKWMRRSRKLQTFYSDRGQLHYA